MALFFMPLYLSSNLDAREFQASNFSSLSNTFTNLLGKFNLQSSVVTTIVVPNLVWYRENSLILNFVPTSKSLNFMKGRRCFSSPSSLNWLSKASIFNKCSSSIENMLRVEILIYILKVVGGLKVFKTINVIIIPPPKFPTSHGIVGVNMSNNCTIIHVT
jgi:hypothetical protein